MTNAAPFEMVVGLETHVELRTRTKMFCSCENAFGGAPNTRVCPVCMGLPGALPTLNGQALRYAALAGMALHCRVHHRSRFDRKNYFYPDLPKAYQISQFYHPLCEGGYLTIQTAQGEKRVGVTRIHMEEDAGKLTHGEANGTAIDMNRCGVPLIEIVSEPDLRSPEEASAYLKKLRAILTCIAVSDCRMNEGSLRCDVNLSVRKPGDPMGVRTEMKNLNSFQSVERAIRAEYQRQAALLAAGERIVQETRRYDQRTGATSSMRRKEDSADYRYFPEPDLPEVCLTDADLSALRAALPPLPDQLRERLTTRWGLTPYMAEQLTEESWLTAYFEAGAEGAASPAALANLILGEAFALMALRDTDHTGERDPGSLPVAPEHLARLSDLMFSNRVNSSTGKKILAALFDRDQDPEAYAREHDLFTISDPDVLSAAAEKALAENPGLVVSYKAGKTNVEKALMGKAMALTRGKADPEKLRLKLLSLLNPS